MHKLLILIITFLPLIVCGQQLKCCESTKEVKNYLRGRWEIQNSESKTVYRYWFEDGQGNFENYEPSDNGKELITEDNHAFVNIIKGENGFKLKYTYLYGDWISEVNYLSEEKLILITNGTKMEYCKVEK
jgi:hypothetical protein